MKLVLSAEPPAGTLIADYLAQADSPPGPPQPAGHLEAWAESVAQGLRTAHLPVTNSYPSGRHVVDVCVGNRWEAAAVECAVHPLGPAAHIDRHLALSRAGWQIFEEYQSKWGQRYGELLVELTQALDGTRGR